MGYMQAIDLGVTGYAFHFRQEMKEAHWRMLHAHQGIEMLYIYSGRGEISVENDKYPLRSGTLVVFQPYQLHRVEVRAQQGEPYIRTNLTFNPHLVAPWLKPFPKLAFFYRQLWQGVLTRQVFQVEDQGRLASLLEEFYASHSQPLADPEEDRILFFLSLLRHLHLNIFPGGNAAFADQPRAKAHVERVMDWVEAHYREPFRLQRIAMDLHLSPYHLSHLFTQFTGRTMTDYIAARRIRAACDLLVSTDKPIKTIAREVGGLSDAYFCQLFKKVKGIPPQAYRETVRGLVH